MLQSAELSSGLERGCCDEADPVQTVDAKRAEPVIQVMLYARTYFIVLNSKQSFVVALLLEGLSCLFVKRRTIVYCQEKPKRESRCPITGLNC